MYNFPCPKLQFNTLLVRELLSLTPYNLLKVTYNYPPSPAFNRTPDWGDCLFLYYVVYGSGLGSFGGDLVFVQDAAEMDDFGGRQIKEFFLLQAAQYFNG